MNLGENDDLNELLSAWRDHLETGMAEWKLARGYRVDAGNPASKDMCRGVAWATAAYLTHETDRQWAVAGGWHRLPADPKWHAFVRATDIPGGMADRDGTWHGHYWAVEQERTDDDPEAPRRIVDLAADQFGWPSVIVSDEADPRYGANLWEDEIDFEIGLPSRELGEKWVASYVEKAFTPAMG